jgi:hypothetical protein
MQRGKRHFQTVERGLAKRERGLTKNVFANRERGTCKKRRALENRGKSIYE